jgi:hypothetical protein
LLKEEIEKANLCRQDLNSGSPRQKQHFSQQCHAVPVCSLIYMVFCHAFTKKQEEEELS